jgi:hypothetical protein
MRALASILWAAAFAGLYGGCSDDRLSGNTAGTDNAVAARTIRVDSVLPVWNEPVRAPTVATLRFDSTNMDFPQTDSAGRDLSVKSEADSAIPFEIVYWDKSAKLGRVRVRIEPNLLHNGSRFLVRWKQALQTRSNPLAVWQSLPDSQILALRSVPVADFENRNDTTLLPTHPTWTYSSHPDTGKDSSQISAVSFLPAGAGRSGGALSLTYKTMGIGYVVVKTPLVVGESARNLRAMDSLVFWVRGTKGSSLYTAFDHGTSFKAWKLDTLDTVWTRIRIRPSDFIPASQTFGGNRGWEAVQDSATDLTFIIDNGTSISLDDIRLYGIDRDDLK